MPDGVVNRARAGLLFIESYRELPLLAWPRTLIDAVVALEEAMLLWRTSHARMVERIIGRRIGTGGSSGVDYLDMTTRYRIFVDLWAVRTLLNLTSMASRASLERVGAKPSPQWLSRSSVLSPVLPSGNSAASYALTQPHNSVRSRSWNCSNGLG